jgi:hypothetical protein
MNRSLQYAEKAEARLVTIAQFGNIIWQTARRCPCAKIQPEDGCLVVEDDIEEGTVHVQPVVVVNEAHLAEPIHEETDA